MTSCDLQIPTDFGPKRDFVHKSYSPAEQQRFDLKPLGWTSNSKTKAESSASNGKSQFVVNRPTHLKELLQIYAPSDIDI